MSSIVIPDSVTSIGGSAFGGCSSLESITLPFVGSSADATSASSSTLFGYIFGTSSYAGGTATKQYYAYASRDNATYYIPATLTTVIITGGNIFYGAFYDCTSLTNIMIPDSVTSIGNYAFYYCTALTEINFNATAMDDLSSGNHVFEYAGTSADGIAVVIGANVTKIPAYMFSSSAKIVSVEFEEGSVCESIGSDAFSGCTSLPSITIPDSVTSIGTSAFYGCDSLENVNYLGTASQWVSISFGNISANPLYYAGNLYLNGTLLTDLKDIDIVTISAYAFAGWNVTSITIPDSVTSIGSDAFYECSSLTSVTIPFVGDGSSNTHFGYIFGASSYNGGSYNNNESYVPTSLTTVVITGGSSIESSAFYNCSSLTSITIPDSVTSIGTSAFYGCSSLTSITIPDSVTSIGSSAFIRCTSLESIAVGKENTVYHSNGNCLIKTASKTLISGCKNSVIPTDGSVTSIGSYAFYGCNKLTSITIPDSVTSIGSYAFYYCTSLESVFYNGTTDEWGEITMVDNEYYLTSATIYYYSETEPDYTGGYNY